jgi:hypothetical protein
MDIFGGKRAKPIIVIPGAEAVEYQPREHVPKPAPQPVARARRPNAIEQLAEAVRPARPAPQPEPVAAVVEDHRRYEELTGGVRDEMFWELIASLQWRNQSDGYVNAHAVRTTIRNFNRLQTRVFKDRYDHYYTQMENILEDDGMFERNDADSPVARAKVVSHAIAMGRDQYMTLSDDLAFFQFFIEAGECQSLDALLPEELSR